MRAPTILFVLFSFCVYSALCTTYTWTQGIGTWYYYLPATYWTPQGLPGPDDTVVFPAGSYVTFYGEGYPIVRYPFGQVYVGTFANVIIENKATLIIDSNNLNTILNVTGQLVVQTGGTLVIDTFSGGIEGPGDIIVNGTFNIYSGNIHGTGGIYVESLGTFNIIAPQLDGPAGHPLTEVYIFRNISVYGSANLYQGSVVHFGFWWQPGNASIYVGAGGLLNLQGFFSKYFEGFGEQYNWNFTQGAPQHPLVLPPSWGSIFIDTGGYAFLFEIVYTIFITNYGTLKIGLGAPYYYQPLPWGSSVWNFGSIEYQAGVILTADTIQTCSDLQKWVQKGSKGDIQILVDSFAAVGIWECVPTLSVSNAKIEFTGSGGLIFSSNLLLNNAQLKIHEGVDVVFTQQFHAKDSSIFIPGNSNVKMMFMPKDADGYHNYLDKTVTEHPQNEKKISFSGVKLAGKGSLDMLSELYLEGQGLTVVESEVFFQREYGTCAVTGSGDLTIMKDGFASFGIESTLSGSGKITIFGKAQIPHIASVHSEKHILVQSGGELSIEGKLDMAQGAKIVRF